MIRQNHEGKYICWQCFSEFDAPAIIPSEFDDDEDAYDSVCPNCGSIEVTDVDTYNECQHNNAIEEDNEERRLFDNDDEI